MVLVRKGIATVYSGGLPGPKEDDFWSIQILRCKGYNLAIIYRLPPLPPTPPEFGFSDVMMICVGCWFSYVVNFICKAFVEIDLKNDIIV